jgi:non-heme chloroperoxidase
MPYLNTADRTALYYRDWGDGTPMVFLASQGLSSSMWQHAMSQLCQDGFRCIAYDRRGHGRSDDSGRGYDFDTLADDLSALLEYLDLEDVTLVGHSMGGAEIVRYLTRHGTSRISRIALVSATLPFLLRTPDNPQGLDGALFDGVWSTWRNDWPGWIFDNTPPFVGKGIPDCEVSDALVEWGARDMEQTSLHALLSCSKIVVETDFRPEVAALNIPALVIHGTADASNPIDICGRRTAELLPGAEFKVYENAPHGLFVTHLPRLVSDLRTFAAEPAGVTG